MDIVLIILGIICLITGIAGCFLPVLPGPPGCLFRHSFLTLHRQSTIFRHTIADLVAYRHHHIDLRLFHPDAGQQI